MATEDDRTVPFAMSPVRGLPEVAPEVRRVGRAGNGLVVTGVAGLLLNCLMNFGSLMIAPIQRPEAARPLNNAARALDPAAAERARNAAALVQTCLVALPTLLIYPLAIVSGLRMKQLRSYRLALASSIMVMLPCSCAFLLGLPIGIWALTVLTAPSIKARFQ